MSSELRWAVGVAIAGMLFCLPTIAPAEEESLRDLAQQVFQPLPRDMSTAESPPTPEKVALGRALFFEPRISSDGTTSCARCHQPALYGTDALPRSIGVEHRVTPRNAPTVLNAALHFVAHWRGDRKSVEDQAIQALVGPPVPGIPVPRPPSPG
jgi:cytochrome c peroxidase